MASDFSDLMKIRIFFIIGTFGFSLFQQGCGKADVKNQSFVNNENLAIASANSAPSPGVNIPPGQDPTIDQIIAATPPHLMARQGCEPVDDVNLTISGSQAPVRVKFDASASTAPCGKIIIYAWDFGDGTTGLGARIRHTYKKQGNYSASVFLVDSKGHTTLIRSNHHINVTNNYSISGQITDANGAGISGVTVILNENQNTSVRTDADGNYSFPKIDSGNYYTVTPVKAGHSFEPSKSVFENLSSRQTANFISVQGTVQGKQ